MAGDAFSALSHGALMSITQGADVQEPVLQCVQIKPMGNQGGQERWRVVMSDSVNFMQCMLGQNMNPLIHESKLKKGCICRLRQFQANYVKDKYILVLIDVEILEEYGEPEKLGQPVVIEGQGQPVKAEEQKPQPGNIASNGFYGNKPQQAQAQPQQQRSLPSRSNGASGGGSHGSIYPIEALSPYAHKWTIKARCTFKSDIKTWHNKNGEGKLFSVNFLDDSGEIRATGFNEAVDSWYETIEKGSVYYISSPCKVQLAKKQFSNVNNDYELTFERDTILEKAEDTEGVPQVSYSFVSLADLQNIEKDSTCDCIGILQGVGETSEITSKTSGKPFSKRELTLVDNTGYSVRLTVWGKTAETFDTSLVESVVAFKGVKVSDFGGRSLSLLSSGSMNANPDIDEAHSLKGWYDGTGRTEEFQSHQNTMSTANATTGGKNANKTIAQIESEQLGMGEETDWFTVKATIIFIRSNVDICYPACKSENCNKKVILDDMSGQWRCEKCNVAWDAPDYRYILTVNVADHTGQLWLSCFNETGQAILGMNANDYMQMKEEGDDRKIQELFSEANCKTFNFRCKAKMDNFQDQQRVRYQVQFANPLNFAAEAKKLAEMIKQYSIGEDSLFVS